MTIHVDKEQEWDPFVKDIIAKFKDLEDKIDLVVSNTKHLVEQFDKVIKKVK